MEARITTLDGTLSYTLGCFMQGKGGTQVQFERFVRSCLDDMSHCTTCLSAVLAHDECCLTSQCKCDAYCRSCMDRGGFCMQHVAVAARRQHWHCAKARCSACVASNAECLHLHIMGLSVDCETQQAATMRRMSTMFLQENVSWKMSTRLILKKGHPINSIAGYWCCW